MPLLNSCSFRKVETLDWHTNNKKNQLDKSFNYCHLILKHNKKRYSDHIKWRYLSHEWPHLWPRDQIPEQMPSCLDWKLLWWLHSWKLAWQSFVRPRCHEHPKKCLWHVKPCFQIVNRHAWIHIQEVREIYWDCTTSAVCTYLKFFGYYSRTLLAFLMI